MDRALASGAKGERFDSSRAHYVGKDLMLKTQIQRAIQLLRKGELIVFPTDTVYGLGADASNEQAILQVFAVKKRHYSCPLIVHIPNLEHLGIWADLESLDEKFFNLAKNFWPGALTIVVKKSKNVSNLITSGRDSIGLRIPNHPVALELLRGFNSGIVGTSANISGDNSLVNFEQARSVFHNNLFILSGGKCSQGLESTIISLVENPIILRQGAISLEVIFQKMYG